jgi:hypothetical protein
LPAWSRELDEVKIPKEILKSALVKLQEELVYEMCDPKYSREKAGSSAEREQRIGHLARSMAK